MKKHKGLQKLTEMEILEELLKQSKISGKSIQELPKRDQIKLIDSFIKIYNEKKEAQKDEVLNSIIEQLPEATRKDIWEVNHHNIMNCITDYALQVGCLPPKRRIAEITGLSRQTVDKHFKEFQNSDVFKSYDEQLKIMKHKVIGEVLRQSINGDMRAAKIYLDFVSGQNNRVQTQNNYIQINGVVYNDSKLKTLKPEQLRQIEQIIQSASTIIDVEPTQPD